jgi:hypothetical protein
MLMSSHDVIEKPFNVHDIIIGFKTKWRGMLAFSFFFLLEADVKPVDRQHCSCVGYRRDTDIGQR